jgi:hypothetical protein
VGYLFVVGLPGKRQLLRQFHARFHTVFPSESCQCGSGGAKLVLTDYPLNFGDLPVDERGLLSGRLLLLPSAFVHAPLLVLPCTLSFSFTGYEVMPIDYPAVFGNPGRQIPKQRQGSRPGSGGSQTVHAREKTGHLVFVGLPGKRQQFREFLAGIRAVIPRERFQRGGGGAKLVLTNHALNFGDLPAEDLGGRLLLLAPAFVQKPLLFLPQARRFGFAGHQGLPIDDAAIFRNPGWQITEQREGARPGSSGSQ